MLDEPLGQTSALAAIEPLRPAGHQPFLIFPPTVLHRAQPRIMGGQAAGKQQAICKQV